MLDQITFLAFILTISKNGAGGLPSCSENYGPSWYVRFVQSGDKAQLNSRIDFVPVDFRPKQSVPEPASSTVGAIPKTSVLFRRTAGLAGMNNCHFVSSRHEPIRIFVYDPKSASGPERITRQYKCYFQLGDLGFIFATL